MKKQMAQNHKYNKVNQQKKYHLLNLIYKHKFNVKEAADKVGINYLTAKTIVFFHKNNYKSYQFDIFGKTKINNYAVTASYANIRRINTISEQLIKPKSKIQVICSIGNILNPSKKIIQIIPDVKHLTFQNKQLQHAQSSPLNDQVIEEVNLFDKNMSHSGFHTSDINNVIQSRSGSEEMMDDKKGGDLLEQRFINDKESPNLIRI